MREHNEAEIEMQICSPCWDARNRPVDQHRCEAMTWSSLALPARSFGGPMVCDCPCLEATT
jgi:hypothetical protein